MLHGQIIPIQRKVVQIGDDYLNGDIVQIPDNLGIWPIAHKHSINDPSCLWHLCDKCGELWDLPCENGVCLNSDITDLSDNCYYCGKHWQECDKSDCSYNRNKLFQFPSE